MRGDCGAGIAETVFSDHFPAKTVNVLGKDVNVETVRQPIRWTIQCPLPRVISSVYEAWCLAHG